MASHPTFQTPHALRFNMLAQPSFEDGCCYFTATLKGKRMRVGVTNGALMLLMGRDVESEPLRFLDALHPGLARARDIIQRKFDSNGLDPDGKVLVTESDLAH